MHRKQELELIDRVMQDVTGSDEFMGAKPCVFAGDQRQVRCW
jgi:ATP-dependent DNA helicase PIF1